MTLQAINQKMQLLHQLTTAPQKKAEILEPVACGVDLGTASIVLVVVDRNETPIFCAAKEANVVRDGLVVNYAQAVQIVRELKTKAEEYLEITLPHAAGAIPPGTLGNNRNAVGNVLESCEFNVSTLVDEPFAASLALNVNEGAVVDVGGGTTGISIFKNHEVIFAADEATGGTQMTLVLAGANKLSVAEAEQLKRDVKAEQTNFETVRPVVDKMAAITTKFIQQSGEKVSEIYLVGGATKFSEFRQVFETNVGISVIQTDYPEFVTPLGIALADRRQSL